MRNLRFIMALFLGVLMTQGFGQAVHALGQEAGSSLICDSLPPLNKGVLDYVKTKLNKKVGRGQCWDLAAEALQSVNASWDRAYKFGREVDTAHECVFPGDIIQFEKVIVEYTRDGGIYQESMGHHTAVVFKVNSKGNFELAHQNIGNGSNKVNLTNLDLKNVLKGKITIFRPVI